MLMTDHPGFTPDEAIEQVITAGRDAARRGWTPATAGNFSIRVTGGRMAVTRSGRDKGQLTPDDVVVVDLATPLPPDASAEAGLHGARYRADPGIAAVVHVHAHVAALVSRLNQDQGVLALQGWELQKALAGVTSHEIQLEVPIFPNCQDIPALARQVEERLALGEPRVRVPGYLLAGHGCYAWGSSLVEAQRHLEALIGLCQLQLDWEARWP